MNNTATKMPTVADVVAGQEALGKHFFSPETMAFFGDTFDSFDVTLHDGKVVLFRKPSAYVLLYNHKSVPAGRTFFGAWYVDEIGRLDKIRDEELDAVYDLVMGYVQRSPAEVKSFKSAARAWGRLLKSAGFQAMQRCEAEHSETGKRIPAPAVKTREKLDRIEETLSRWSGYFTGQQLAELIDWADERELNGLFDD